MNLYIYQLRNGGHLTIAQIYLSISFLNMKHTTIATHRLNSITILEHLLVNIENEKKKKNTHGINDIVIT